VMEREHDTRSKRTRDLTVENPRLEAMRRAFESAPTIINHAQALAIANLTLTGAQGGGELADPVPPVVAVAATGQRGVAPDGEPWQGLALLAADGRTWSLTGSGVCWPGGMSFREARRG
jgi:hypothetical protein